METPKYKISANGNISRAYDISSFKFCCNRIISELGHPADIYYSIKEDRIFFIGDDKGNYNNLRLTPKTSGYWEGFRRRLINEFEIPVKTNG